jgi:hypothetical protein
MVIKNTGFRGESFLENIRLEKAGGWKDNV